MILVKQNPEISIALIGLLAALVGYFYRARTEERQNLREALYLLLEIWHRMTIVAYQDFDRFFLLFRERLLVLHPDAQFTKEQFDAAKAHFIPILQRTATGHALKDFSGLQDAYKKVVQLTARSNPVYAFRVESVSGTSKLLALIDEYLKEAFAPFDDEGGVSAQVSEQLKSTVHFAVTENMTRDLQNDLLGLAARISVWTLLDVVLVIRSRRKKLKHGPSNDDMDRIIKTLLTPQLHAAISATHQA